jgi:hypothetical protein
MEPKKIECEFILARRAEEKEPNAKHWCTGCEYDIKLDLKVAVREGVDWIDLFEDTFQWKFFGNG